MKNYDEIARDVFAYRDEYVARQKRTRKTVMRITSVACAFAVVAAVGVGLWQWGVFDTETPLVEEPSTGTTTSQKEIPPIGGDSGECTIHNVYYHRIVGNYTKEQKEAFRNWLGEDFDRNDYNIINFVKVNNITREEFIKAYGGLWTEENLDEIAWNHGNGCPYTKRQFLDAIYGDDAELTAWVFAPISTWPEADNWDLEGVDKDMLPEEWPPEGYGFGETRPSEAE